VSRYCFNCERELQHGELVMFGRTYGDVVVVVGVSCCAQWLELRIFSLEDENTPVWPSSVRWGTA
jgi:hypothetical protein